MNEIKPGFDGMPPVKDTYELEEKRTIAASVDKFGTKAVAEAYGLKWQAVASWRRIHKSAKSEPVNKNAEIIIQSPDGNEITTDAIISKISGQVDKIYVRVDENAAYWVKGNENGSITLW